MFLLICGWLHEDIKIEKHHFVKELGAANHRLCIIVHESMIKAFSACPALWFWLVYRSLPCMYL